MRTLRPFVVITITALVLTACGGAAGLGGSSSALSTNYSNALPPAGQIAAGMFNLEGTALAVDAAQAGQLLPLWQGLQSLLNSSTSSDQEIAAVITQIESNMTADQVAAISAMQLTETDLQGLMIQTSDSSPSTNRSSSRGQSGGFQFGGPGPDGGGLIAGGPGGNSLSGLPGSTSGVAQATQASSQDVAAQTSAGQLAKIGVNGPIIQAVIAFLQGKTG